MQNIEILIFDNIFTIQAIFGLMQNIEILLFAIFYNQEIFLFDLCIYILLFDDFHF